MVKLWILLLYWGQMFALTKRVIEHLSFSATPSFVIFKRQNGGERKKKLQ